MARLGRNRYGKSRVRISRISRHGERHTFQEWTVSILLEGEFEESFTDADNSRILPTDTVKNTVYSLARSSQATTIEEFAFELGDYFLKSHAHIASINIEIAERAWEPLVLKGRPEHTTFKLNGPELQTAHANREREGAWRIVSGVEHLTILKTTKSSFTGYIQDRLTTLKPAKDRILGTCASVRWEYASGVVDYARIRATVLDSLLRVFAEHDSKSVQHTLYDMGKAALAAVPEIARITLTMPNLHHLLADLSPFGQDNPNHIFVPIDEPHGYIEATVERE